MIITIMLIITSTITRRAHIVVAPSNDLDLVGGVPDLRAMGGCVRITIRMTRMVGRTMRTLRTRNIALRELCFYTL